MRVLRKMVGVDMMMNVSRIGMSLLHVMNFLILMHMSVEVVMARSPESVVASPYDGIRNGSMVIMKIPKPKPVVRCTKLAPIVRRNISMILSIRGYAYANLAYFEAFWLLFHPFLHNFAELRIG